MAARHSKVVRYVTSHPFMETPRDFTSMTPALAYPAVRGLASGFQVNSFRLKSDVDDNVHFC